MTQKYVRSGKGASPVCTEAHKGEWSLETMKIDSTYVLNGPVLTSVSSSTQCVVFCKRGFANTCCSFS